MARFHFSILWFYCLLWATASVRGERGAALQVVANWQMKDGLPSEQIRAVLQSRTGYLWIATADGLARFDGARFKLYDIANDSGLTNNYCNRLFEDRTGRLWIIHDTGEVTILEDGRFRQLSLGSDWMGSPVHCVAEDRAGAVWLLNRRGDLRSVRSDQVGPILRQDDQPPIRSMVSDNHGRVWASSDTRVFEIVDGRDISAASGDQLTGLTIPVLFPAQDGGLWIVEQSRFRRWHPGGGKGKIYETDLSSGPGPVTGVETMAGMVLIAIASRGLSIFSPDGSRQEITPSTGLPPSLIQALCEDREGNVWVGTRGHGLSLLRPKTVTMVTLPGDNHNRRILAVTRSEKDGVWIGTRGAGLYHLENEKLRHYSTETGLRHNIVTALTEDGSGTLWLATGIGHVQRFDGRSFQAVATLPSPATRIHALMRTRDGVMWIGGETAATIGFDGALSHLPDEAGEKPSDVRCFAQAANGAIWIGTRSQGLFRYENGKLKSFGRKEGLPGNQIWALHADADGAVWAAIVGYGLSRIRDDRIVTISTKHGLPSDVICHILDDKDGHFWMSSNRGIFRAARSDLQGCADGRRDHVPCLVLDTRDGLTTLEMIGGEQSTACRTDDGRLWFATARGVAMIAPDLVRTNNPSPVVIVEEVRVGGQRIEFDKKEPSLSTSIPVVTIPPGSHGIEIDYTGLSLGAPNRARFRYRFEGLDTEWTDVGGQRTAYYRHLSPGDYKFRVMASTGEGSWNNAFLALKILPFFWQTRWFVSLVFLAGVLAIAAVVRAATQRAHRVRLIEIERQRSIERDRTRIAHDLHDDIGAGLTQLTLLAHAAQNLLPKSAGAGARVDEMQKAIRGMTESLDEIVWAVNPRHDSLDSLVSYLGKFAQDFLHHGGVRCVLDFPLEMKDFDVTSEVRHSLYLAMREALHNVLRHAGATEVRVSMSFAPGRAALQIEDNGRGFPAAGSRQETNGAGRLSHGVGLQSMRRRIEEIGGECSFDDRPGGGARVILRIFVSPAPPTREPPGRV